LNSILGAERKLKSTSRTIHKHYLLTKKLKLKQRNHIIPTNHLLFACRRSGAWAMEEVKSRAARALARLRTQRKREIEREREREREEVLTFEKFSNYN